MSFRLAAVFLSLLIFISSPAFGDQADLKFNRIRGDYSGLMKSTKKKLYRENWLRVIDEFRRFSQEYPSHKKGPAALYMAAKASQELYRISYSKKDAVQAGEYFDSVGTRFPQSSLADDSLMLSAGIQESILSDSHEAISRYEKVLKKYPRGDQAGKAREKLSRLSPYALEALSRPAPPPAAKKTNSTPVLLAGVRSFSAKGYTRVVLDVTQSTGFSFNALSGSQKEKTSPRVYVDLKNTFPGPGLKSKQNVKDTYLKCIRTGIPGKGKTRVVLDLKVFQDYRVFALENPSRVVIDIAGQEMAWEDPVASSQDPRPPPRSDNISKLLKSSSKKEGLSINIPAMVSKHGLKIIVVDPGHGGKDPGAIGLNGIKEKDVVLAIAKTLAKQLKKEFMCEVVLTRDRDIFIPLQKRTELANRLNADLFISVHANASLNRKVCGVETYYLNFTKNDAAAPVAARENGTTLKEVSELEMILFDLMANAKINESSLLANKVQKAVIKKLSGKYSAVRDHGVRQGPFHVLLGASMPSILVETAYLSNRRDESRLVSRKYQERVAMGIVSGVKNFATTLDLVAKK